MFYDHMCFVGDMCRICHCVAEDSETLISPCDCCGSMKWVHQKCLQRWVKSRDAKKCELCGFPFNMTSSVKPFRKVSAQNKTHKCLLSPSSIGVINGHFISF